MKVRARSNNSAGRLIPGAFAKVDVRLDKVDNALIIPAEESTDIQGQKVLLMKGGKVVSARVQSASARPTVCSSPAVCNPATRSLPAC